MKAATLLSTRLWTAVSAISIVLLFSLGSSAQVAYGTYGPDRHVPSVSSWERLEQLSAQLEQQADRVRADAKADQRHHGSEEFAERTDDFAKQAHRFRTLVNERGVTPSKIDDELRKLVDESRKVQQESAKAEHHNPHTDAEWNQVLATLDQLNSAYLAATGLTPPAHEGYAASSAAYQAWNGDRSAMFDDLSRRADDAARVSESASFEVTPEIERLRDQVRSYEQNAARLGPDETRANIEEMLSEARAVQADLSGSNAPARLRDDVNGMVDTLTQMRDTHTVVGTSGYGPAPAIAPYDTMDAAQLSRELDSRIARISALAGESGSDDVSSQVARFSGQVRDFDARAPRMSSEDRREALDRLLQDAQKTQRDFASRHVSGELMSAWNDVVNLLVHMRDRS